MKRGALWLAALFALMMGLGRLPRRGSRGRTAAEIHRHRFLQAVGQQIACRDAADSVPALSGARVERLARDDPDVALVRSQRISYGWRLEAGVSRCWMRQRHRAQSFFCGEQGRENQHDRRSPGRHHRRSRPAAGRAALRLCRRGPSGQGLREIRRHQHAVRGLWPEGFRKPPIPARTIPCARGGKPGRLPAAAAASMCRSTSPPTRRARRSRSPSAAARSLGSSPKSSAYLNPITTPSAPSASCSPSRCVLSRMVTPLALLSHKVPLPWSPSAQPARTCAYTPAKSARLVRP